jgi:hypothetical protein
LIDYESSEGEVEIYCGKQWIVSNYGMRAVIHQSGRHAPPYIYYLSRETVGEHCPNVHNPKFRYSCISHVANKTWPDLEDFIIAFRIACSCYEVDTAGWLNCEIEHTREKRRYYDAASALRAELFPNKGFRSLQKFFEEEETVAAELAKRGIIDPDAGCAQWDEPAKREEAR